MDGGHSNPHLITKINKKISASKKFQKKNVTGGLLEGKSTI